MIYSTASIFPSKASEKSHHPSGAVLSTFVNPFRSLHLLLSPAHDHPVPMFINFTITTLNSKDCIYYYKTLHPMDLVTM